MSRQKRGMDAGELRRHGEQLANWLLVHPFQGEVDPQRLLHELKVYQIELEMQNAELRRAQTVTDTTVKEAKLLNEKLAKRLQESAASRKAADATMRAKGASLAKMTVEMRTALKVIVEMSRQIRRRSVDAELAKRLGKLDAASKRLLKVSKAALALSRL